MPRSKQPLSTNGTKTPPQAIGLRLPGDLKVAIIRAVSRESAKRGERITLGAWVIDAIHAKLNAGKSTRGGDE